MFKGIIKKGERKDFLWKDFTLSVTQNNYDNYFTVAVSREESFHVSGYQVQNSTYGITAYNKYGTGTIELSKRIGYYNSCSRLELFIWTGKDGEHYEVTIYINNETGYLYITVQHRSLDELGKIESKFLPYCTEG